MNFFERFDRFIFPVTECGCWIWMSTATPKGYGWIRRNKAMVYAHRAAYEAVHGEGSAAGLLVRHTCDVPSCVNPDHLLIGTHADNGRDMRERGRSLRGERNTSALLTRAQAASIRAMCSAGVMQAVAGRLFGVGQSAVSLISRSKRWGEISVTEERRALRAWIKQQPEAIRCYADFIPMHLWLAERYPQSDAMRSVLAMSVARLTQETTQTCRAISTCRSLTGGQSAA